DGTQWSIIDTPTFGYDESDIFDVAAVSSNNVWAVGYHVAGGYSQTLIIHWDGTQWSVIPSPNPASHWTGELYSVVAISADDVWAVGASRRDASRPRLLEPWDGVQWSITTPPSVGEQGQVYAVAALTGRDVWSVGYFGPQPSLSSLVMHYSGSNCPTATPTVS